ncbi:MAG: CAP domain-containing protein [Treponema sp.]|nr:CAP domain-containing protein [Treponema sp.]MBQ2553339.1 CAP domain-containing protein [Treponema sp.]MBQ5383076.1 CAP domain-containing protein [Treponema sp.]
MTAIRNVFLVVFATMMVFPMSPRGSKNKSSDNNVQQNVDPKVKEAFDCTNDFRTGSEAYYWNRDNRTKTNLVGKLGKLTLDEELCKAAQIRADEIVKKFSHTRPNGESCFSVFDDLSIDAMSQAENIAAGSSTGKGTFIQWKEDDEDYSGQGHRRNMLGKDYSRIGIAYSYSPKSEYKYYWVMVLAD